MRFIEFPTNFIFFEKFIFSIFFKASVERARVSTVQDTFYMRMLCIIISHGVKSLWCNVSHGVAGVADHITLGGIGSPRSFKTTMRSYTPCDPIPPAE